MQEKTIILIGMPGSGKTALGKILAKNLNKDYVDVDEFIFETTGRDSSEHLQELGYEGFLDFECETVKKIIPDKKIIASSGSVPLRIEGLNYLRKNNSVVVWLDVHQDVLKNRIEVREDGASRIVGAQTMSLDEILDWRKSKYNDNHDIRVQISKENTKESNAQKILDAIEAFFS